MRYGRDYGTGGGRGAYGRGMRGGRRGMIGIGYGEDYYGGAERGPFRGRAGPYETYSRRDFRTNQGDFSDDSGGGPNYGYRGTGREFGRRGSPPGYRGVGPGAGFEGPSRAYDVGYRTNRGRGGGRSEGRFRGEEMNYGPGYGDRWETTTGYDIAYRNFDR